MITFLKKLFVFKKLNKISRIIHGTSCEMSLSYWYTNIFVSTFIDCYSYNYFLLEKCRNRPIFLLEKCHNLGIIILENAQNGMEVYYA